MRVRISFMTILKKALLSSGVFRLPDEDTVDEILAQGADAFLGKLESSSPCFPIGVGQRCYAKTQQNRAFSTAG